MTRPFVRTAALAVALAVPTALAGCGPDYSPNTYTSNAVQQAAKVDKGIVVGARAVDVTTSGVVGAATGAAAGGALGSDTPGGGVTSTLGAIGGGLVGGLIGTSMEHTVTDTTAYEYIVEKTTRELVSVTQKDAKPLTIGVHVLVIAGPQARIVPDYTVEPTPTATLTPPPSPKPGPGPGPVGPDPAVAAPPQAANAPPFGNTAPSPPPVNSTELAPLPLTPPAGASAAPPVGATPPPTPPPAPGIASP